MPRGRRRKDPSDAPISGDYTRDVILDRDPSKTYALVSVDDLPVMRGRGFVRTERTADGTGARPAWDVGEGDGGYLVGGQLLQMECDKGRAEAVQKRSEAQFANQMQGLHESLRSRKSSKYGSVGPDPANPMSFKTQVQ